MSLLLLTLSYKHPILASIRDKVLGLVNLSIMIALHTLTNRKQVRETDLLSI